MIFAGISTFRPAMSVITRVVAWDELLVTAEVVGVVLAA
ncbi:hypothetical protein DSBG_3953 [Desulfosporosinus sp. BG]|nr:hypothetical protein DSBG_3953 [Desulfosporosinus sp. BG]